MKKKLIIMIFLVFMLIPLKIEAASITSSHVSTVAEQEVGSKFNVPFYVNFSGIERNSENTSGIFMVGLKIKFDDSILEVTDIYSDWFDSVVYKDGNNYYIVGMADEDSTGNKCVDNFLACSNYTAVLQFFVKSNAKESTDIIIEEASAIVFKMDKTLESYTDENMIELDLIREITSTVKIKKTDTVKETESTNQSPVINEKVPNIKTDTIEEAKKNSQTVSSNSNSNSNTTNNNKNNSNSSNNEDSNNKPEDKNEKPPVEEADNRSTNSTLKSIEISEYDLKFKKDRLSYELIVGYNVKSLDIKVTPEDRKATYQIIGADDLKDEVKIIVKAENGQESFYTIEIKRQKEGDTLKEKLTRNGGKDAIVFGVSALAIILLICFIVSHHRNHKIDKMLDKM